MLDHEKLKALREKKGLTMEEAAAKAGFASRQHWYMIESGKRLNIELATLDKIADAVGVKAKDLLK